jgi:alginate O-acetyltransferase complex protein AlgI
MLFASQLCLFVLIPTGILLHCALMKWQSARLLFLCFFSIFVLTWVRPAIALLILYSALVCWGFGFLVAGGRRKKQWLLMGTALFILPMLAYKYLGELQAFLPWSLDMTSVPLLAQIALPVGQLLLWSRGISYLVDVYRGEAPIAKNPLKLGVYLSFFPFFLPGPLVRYQDFAPQLTGGRLTGKMAAVGLCRLIVGLAKVVILGGSLAIVSDLVFNYAKMGQNLVPLSALSTALGLLAFCLQIYYDLSGASNIVVGLHYLFGLKIEEQVDYPYLAGTVSSFWTKFCSSYYSWFQHYVGGALLKGKDSEVLRVFVVFLLYSFWLGSHLGFLMIGLLNGVVLVGEAFFGRDYDWVKAWVRRCATLLVVVITMVFWRTGDLFQASQFFLSLLGLNSNPVVDSFGLLLAREYGAFLILGLVFVTPIAPRVNTWLVREEDGGLRRLLHGLYPVAMLLLLLLTVVYLIELPVMPYPYFYY